MPKVRVYVDTSVFGGVHDEEFARASRRFFELVGKGTYTVLLSVETSRELEGAPTEVVETVNGLPPDAVESVEIDEEVEALAAAYLDAGVVSAASREDALHVAAATVAGADLVLSWNFKRIVRYDRVRGFNGVNALKGYRPLDIRSPLEVEHEED